MIHVNNLYKSFGKNDVLKGIDEHIEKGEVVVVIGPSGSGKSMTLKCIAGLEKADKGKIIINDKVLFDSENKINIKTKDRKVGFLFQNYALFPHMTIKNNLK